MHSFDADAAMICHLPLLFCTQHAVETVLKHESHPPHTFTMHTLLPSVVSDPMQLLVV